MHQSLIKDGFQVEVYFLLSDIVPPSRPQLYSFTLRWQSRTFSPFIIRDFFWLIHSYKHVFSLSETSFALSFLK